jgi:hypothetical protein
MKWDRTAFAIQKQNVGESRRRPDLASYFSGFMKDRCSR